MCNLLLQAARSGESSTREESANEKREGARKEEL